MRSRFAVCLVIAVAAFTSVSYAQPSDAGEKKIIDLEFRDAPIEAVISKIATQTTATIAARGKTRGARINMQAKELTLPQALDMLANQGPNWLWRAVPTQPGTYEIWDQESYRAEVMPTLARQRTHKVEFITAEEAYQATKKLLTPNIGAAAFDPRTNQLIVTDLPNVQEMIARFLEQIDVKFETKVFRIKYADVNSMAEKLSASKSPAAPSPIVDNRTKQIIVRDRKDIIAQMEKLLEILDVDTEMKVFKIKYADMRYMEDRIGTLVSPNGPYHVDDRTRQIIVEESPETIRKMEKLVSILDIETTETQTAR